MIRQEKNSLYPYKSERGGRENVKKMKTSDPWSPLGKFCHFDYLRRLSLPGGYAQHRHFREIFSRWACSTLSFSGKFWIYPAGKIFPKMTILCIPIGKNFPVYLIQGLSVVKSHPVFILTFYRWYKMTCIARKLMSYKILGVPLVLYLIPYVAYTC